MFRRIPGLLLWILVACAVAILPIACGSDGNGSDGSASDGAYQVTPSSMTGG